MSAPNRCLSCGRPLPPDADSSCHPACSRRLFGTPRPPVLARTWAELDALAKTTILHRISVPGVQPKLSLHLETGRPGAPARLTLVGLAGDYILKPPSPRWPHLPEAEHFAMLLARTCGLPVAEFGLLPLDSGELAYICRRMDRPGGGPRHMEDFCQILGKVTAQKYNGSMEQIGKAIRGFSDAPGLDALAFFELAVYCFLTGNSDMHLKNFSLLETAAGGWELAPAYDLVPVNVILPDDPEELALTLDGKKNRLRRDDFLALAASLRLTPRQTDRALDRILSAVRDRLSDALSASFLPPAMQTAVSDLVFSRLSRL
ncbi:MAG: HipA domain-containing protein [Kiritimatiellae bacterium]|nr:HipA domain-containing protein [Kiritimatiellia bacterium]